MNLDIMKEYYKTFIKKGEILTTDEISVAEIQTIYFKWLFINSPNISPMDAIVKFNDKYKGSKLLVSQQLSCIKGRIYKLVFLSIF